MRARMQRRMTSLTRRELLCGKQTKTQNQFPRGIRLNKKTHRQLGLSKSICKRNFCKNQKTEKEILYSLTKRCSRKKHTHNINLESSG
jgi:hypothetical protein